MKKKFSWMQLVRVIVMIIAVAAILFALEYLPKSPLMWISVGLLFVGFTMLLFIFRSQQQRRKREKQGLPTHKK
ncbi:MAG: hypothetical protein IJF77_03205 [Alistipes sp.]|nr:hypothetical protein [Alistipes sp.]MBQ3082717.1 hypothetical protein [Alistipes sp.]